MADAAPANKTAAQMMVQYFKDFGVIRDNPREYWGIQVVNFLDSLAYFAFFNMVVVFLTDNIGWNDVNAGYIFTAFTMLVTISLFVGGFVTDWLGIKRGLYVAMGMAFVARGGIMFCGLVDFPGRAWAVIPFFLLASPSMAMTQTLFQSANRRYSTPRSRSASFNAWYLIMNLGAAGAGFTIDLIRKTMGLDNSWIYGFAAFTCILSTIAVFFMVKREEQVLGEGEKAEIQTEEQKREGLVQRLSILVRQESFWRFMVLCVAVLGVRAVFLYFGMLLPKYWLRVIGPEAPIGWLQTINPILVIIGLVLMIPITGRFNVLKMLVFGATISALSMLVLVMPWSWFGGDVASGYLHMSIVFAVILSLGELLWSPRLQEYTAAIAPKGQEGAYLGMSMMPYFFAKLVVSALSGHMLMRWCPEGIGEPIRAGTLTFWQSPEAMWLVLFFWAIAGPAIVWAARGWLTRGTDLEGKAA
ncbi:MAG: MFS transporter [Pseudomonadota bacterium]